MAYKSIFKTNREPSTGYKSIFDKEEDAVIREVGFPKHLGGGRYLTSNDGGLFLTPRSQDALGASISGSERDHIVPVSAGGTSGIKNLQYLKSPHGTQFGDKGRQEGKVDVETSAWERYNAGDISLPQYRLATQTKQQQIKGLVPSDKAQKEPGGKFGELADTIVGLFKGIKDKSKKESKKEDVLNIAETLSKRDISQDTLSQGKQSLFKKAEFGDTMIPSKLQLPEDNWAYRTINTLYNIPSEAKANLVNKLSEAVATEPTKPGDVVQKPVQDTPLKRVVAGINIGTASLGLIPQWLVLTTGLQAAENVPVIKHPAKAINWGFEKLAEAGTFIADVGVDIAPLSDETKETIRPAVEELAALATQLVGAHKGGKIVSKTTNKIKIKIKDRQTKGEEITPKVAEEIVAEVKTETETENYQKALDDFSKDPTPETLDRAITAKATEAPVKPQEATGEVLTPKVDKTTPKTKDVKTEPLTAEAKKFKTADEFVEKNTYYRGEGGKDVAQGKALLAEGRHFAFNDEIYPKRFGNVKSYIAKPNVKIFKSGDSTFPELSKKLGIPKRNYIPQKELTKILKEKGYDIFEYTGTLRSTKKPFTHIVEITKDSLIPKTKSQLTDIWKKANTPAVSKVIKTKPIIPEKTPLVPKKPVKTEPLEAKPILTPKISKSIEQKAIDSKLIPGFDKLPEVERVNFKEQAQKNADLFNNDIARADRIINGEEALPVDYTLGHFLDAAEQHIKLTKDVDMAYRLANSKIVSETSKVAQQFGSLRIRERDSLTKSMAEIKKARENQSVSAKDIKKSIKKEVSKNKLSKEDRMIDRFLDSIKC